jgi:DNA-binding MarR family transcriptional regulator
MSLHVERLVRQGYVIRERDPADRRVLALRLTDAGVRVKRAQTVLDPARVASVLGRLAPEERRLALEGLALLARAAERETASRGAGASAFGHRAAP